MNRVEDTAAAVRRVTGSRRWVAVAGLGLAVLSGLTGCAGGDGGDGSSDRSTTTPSSSSTTAPTITTTTIPPTTTTTIPPTTTTTIPPTELPEPAGPLQSGSVGTRTKAIQAALKDQRYDPGPPDGKFGLKTTQAVWAFQALHGLAKDGVVGPETEAQILARAPQAMLRPELGPTHTEIDLTRQILIVWRDGAPALITHVSSGSQVPYCETSELGRSCGSAVTPLGNFTWYRRVEGWRVAVLGKLYNPVYFTGGFAVHGAGSVPNHPASHGCVRIPMGIAEYFPSLVANGEPVAVFRS